MEIGNAIRTYTDIRQVVIVRIVRLQIMLIIAVVTENAT
jgi:hypothetical protein